KPSQFTPVKSLSLSVAALFPVHLCLSVFICGLRFSSVLSVPLCQICSAFASPPPESPLHRTNTHTDDEKTPLRDPHSNSSCATPPPALPFAAPATRTFSHSTPARAP